MFIMCLRFNSHLTENTLDVYKKFAHNFQNHVKTHFEDHRNKRRIFSIKFDGIHTNHCLWNTRNHNGQVNLFFKLKRVEWISCFSHNMTVEDGKTSSDGKIFTKPIIRKDLRLTISGKIRKHPYVISTTKINERLVLRYPRFLVYQWC